MEAEMVSRANALVSIGKVEDANRIVCWLYAYWKLRGIQSWRSIYVTGCVDEELENLVTGNYPRETSMAILSKFIENPNIESFVKLVYAEAMYGFGLKPKRESLLALARKVGFDKLGELTGEVSLIKRGRVEEPWLILTQIDVFRKVTSRWLEELR